MGWKQVRSFDPAKMGTRKGWCLMNVRLGFGIPSGHYPSAKADMEAQRARGTLRPMNTLPTNRAVAVYVDTSSPNEHVIAYDHGTWWSDGRRLTSTTGLNFFGWGELCDNARVVEYTADPTPTPPTPTTGFLPAKGYWCRYDKDNRVAQLASFMRKAFPAYTSAKALGPVYGDYLWKAIKEFQKRTGLVADGMVGPKTYAKLKQYGFNG